MIEDRAYDELPGDPEIAFLNLEGQYRDRLESNLKSLDDDSSAGFAHFYIEYMNHVTAAAAALELGIFEEWRLPDRRNDIYDAYRDFSTQVDHYKVQIKIHHSRRSKRYGVVLTNAEKETIRHYLKQIKTVIDESSLSEEKKSSLYNKIAELNLEVDKDRAPLERFADFMSDLAQISKNFAQEGAEPWWKWARPIFEVLGAAKDREDAQTQLPSPKERKRLEPPRRGLLPPKGGDLDDEVPF